MRTHRILLTTAGAGNAINVVRSLRSAFSSFTKRVYIVGTNINHYELAKSNADKHYKVPPFTEPAKYCDSIAKLIEKERIDFMIPNHEFEIAAIRRFGDERILNKCFLPDLQTIEVCIDKLELMKYLEERGITRIPKSYDILSLKDLERDYDYPMWVRLRSGAGSRGATLVHDEEELKNWVFYWLKHKPVNISDFMISEYLPGDDHHYFSLWKDGEMVMGKGIQRLQYCCAKYTLTGTSSSPSMCKLVYNPELDWLTEKIIKALPGKANGLFGIDYKADKKGRPCLTEINIGRFPRINYIFNHVGPNMAELYYYCGRGIKFDLESNVMNTGEGWYLFRDFDLGLKLVNEKDLWEYEYI